MNLESIIMLCNGNRLSEAAEYSEEGNWVTTGSQSDSIARASCGFPCFPGSVLCMKSHGGPIRRQRSRMAGRVGVGQGKGSKGEIINP